MNVLFLSMIIKDLLILFLKKKVIKVNSQVFSLMFFLYFTQHLLSQFLDKNIAKYKCLVKIFNIFQKKFN